MEWKRRKRSKPEWYRVFGLSVPNCYDGDESVSNDGEREG